MKRYLKSPKVVFFSLIKTDLWHHRGCQLLNLFIILSLALYLSSCAGHRAPSHSLEQPPSRKLQHHTVSRGETLYAIAWRYDKDFKELARVNRILAPYRIFPGQKLQLHNSSPLAGATKDVKRATKHKSVQAKSLIPIEPGKKKPKPGQVAILWRWPVKGKLITRFEAKNPLRKGIDIAGKKREAIYAAADGAVIYAGSALRGYGNLLIVKHSEEFLSAYAHNYRLIVGEGMKVKVGQAIAEMGSTGTSRDMLHFEIRRNGQPVNPLSYLP